jgi:hypothetical protein
MKQSIVAAEWSIAAPKQDIVATDATNAIFNLQFSQFACTVGNGMEAAFLPARM